MVYKNMSCRDDAGKISENQHLSNIMDNDNSKDKGKAKDNLAVKTRKSTHPIYPDYVRILL